MLEKRLLTPQLTQLILAPTIYIPYQAGQYLKLQLPNNPHPYSYSIANAPNAEQTYELHIRHGIEPAELTCNTMLTLELPFGSCTLAALDPTLPMVLVAGGTGFAPIKALLEQLQQEHTTQPRLLIWRTKNQDELYLDDLVKTWQHNDPGLLYYPQFTREPIHALVEKYAPLSSWQFVLAGPFDMVYNLRDELVAAGIPRARLHSDAFAFETHT
jgi:CDP-4-dehydro-6-deoxyglucose reductase